MSDWEWLCVDDPTAHQLTSGSNMKPHADTHSCFKPHIRPSAQRYVCAGVVVVVAVGEGVEEVRGGRKECVRGISERGRERRGERGRRNDTKEKCACEQVCMKGCPVQSIKNFEPAIRHMACGPKMNKMTTVLSCHMSLYMYLYLYLYLSMSTSMSMSMALSLSLSLSHVTCHMSMSMSM